jgi:hypothetical protein
MNDDVSVVSDASEFSSNVRDHGLRHVRIKIQNGSQPGFDGQTMMRQVQPMTATALDFILSALDMQRDNFESRCIAGSFALKAYEE